MARRFIYQLVTVNGLVTEEPLRDFIAAGDLPSDVAYTDIANTFTKGPQTVVIDADANKGVVIKGHSTTQSANLQEWQNYLGAVLASVDNTGGIASSGTIITGANFQTAGGLFTADATGLVTANQYATPGGLFSADVNGLVAATKLIVFATADTVQVQVVGFVGQTANLQEWQDSGQAVLSAVAKNGAFKPASLADIDAENGTIYYSTTASKLVYKDSGGVVNNLY